MSKSEVYILSFYFTKGLRYVLRRDIDIDIGITFIISVPPVLPFYPHNSKDFRGRYWGQYFEKGVMSALLVCEG